MLCNSLFIPNTRLFVKCDGAILLPVIYRPLREEVITALLLLIGNANVVREQETHYDFHIKFISLSDDNRQLILQYSTIPVIDIQTLYDKITKALFSKALMKNIIYMQESIGKLHLVPGALAGEYHRATHPRLIAYIL